jgi:hypothetical protein
MGDAMILNVSVANGDTREVDGWAAELIDFISEHREDFNRTNPGSGYGFQRMDEGGHIFTWLLVGPDRNNRVPFWSFKEPTNPWANYTPQRNGSTAN